MELVVETTASSSSSLKPHDGGSSSNNASSKKATSSKCPPHGGGNFRRWEWDMLTRFHAGYFRISLALSGQALLWRTLISDSAAASSSSSGHGPLLPLLPSVAFLLLWSLALLALLALAALYAARCLLRFPAVRAEFRHHVAMNYLFAPWISCLLLLQSAPFLFLRPSAPPYHLLWWAFSLPILALDVKIYGQWFTRGRKFLSMVANPASHITVIGNLVTARAAARMDGLARGRSRHLRRRRRALPRALRHALPEVPRIRLAAGHAAPGLLPLLRSAQHGVARLGRHISLLRHMLQDALLPLPLPLRIPRTFLF
jgi:hypothetical protein